MIVAIVGIVHGHDLLPYYLDHYRRQGVERFVIACDPSKIDETGELGRRLAAERDIQLVPVPRSFVRAGVPGMVEEEVRARVATANDWVIPADLDELNQYPTELGELVREMSESGTTHVTGELSDRLALEGKLNPLRPFSDGVSIWDQYPLEADVTARIVRGHTEKVLVSRGDLPWWMGHHRMQRPESLRAHPASGKAHHFKWRDGLSKMLAWRVGNEQRARVPWSDQSVRLDEYLQTHGRIVPEHVGARPGWRPT